MVGLTFIVLVHIILGEVGPCHLYLSSEMTALVLVTLSDLELLKEKRNLMTGDSKSNYFVWNLGIRINVGELASATSSSQLQIKNLYTLRKFNYAFLHPVTK